MNANNLFREITYGPERSTPMTRTEIIERLNSIETTADMVKSELDSGDYTRAADHANSLRGDVASLCVDLQEDIVDGHRGTGSASSPDVHNDKDGVQIP